MPFVLLSSVTRLTTFCHFSFLMVSHDILPDTICAFELCCLRFCLMLFVLLNSVYTYCLCHLCKTFFIMSYAFELWHKTYCLMSFMLLDLLPDVICAFEWCHKITSWCHLCFLALSHDLRADAIFAFELQPKIFCLIPFMLLRSVMRDLNIYHLCKLCQKYSALCHYVISVVQSDAHPSGDQEFTSLIWLGKLTSLTWL